MTSQQSWIGSLARSLSAILVVASICSVGCKAVIVPSESQILLTTDSVNPLAGKPFFVDPTSSAMAAANTSQPPSPELTAIANTPTAYWIDQNVPAGAVAAIVRRLSDAAQAADAMPVLTLYAIPHRDCGSYATGGFQTGADYRQWIDEVTNGLGAAPAAVILEPDALTMTDCLTADQQYERFELLRYAVSALTRDAAAAVYIDGGHSRWLSPVELADRLEQVGVGQTRGFSLNTSNFFTTEEEIGYGEEVSALTNGAHYVIDTSRNGVGPAPDAPLNWCNPTGRALGNAPTTDTAGAHADAYLWIKRPGESDGMCDRGDPHSGIFMPQYAVDLARAAGW